MTKKTIAKKTATKREYKFNVGDLVKLNVDFLMVPFDENTNVKGRYGHITYIYSEDDDVLDYSVEVQGYPHQERYFSEDELKAVNTKDSGKEE